MRRIALASLLLTTVGCGDGIKHYARYCQDAEPPDTSCVSHGWGTALPQCPFPAREFMEMRCANSYDLWHMTVGESGTCRKCWEGWSW